jgi:group I intron endonuclease
MFIYLVTNLVNHKTYVGQTTKSVEHRFRHHCYSAGGGSNTLLHKAIRKYGVASFQVTILEVVTEDINAREVAWIAKLSPEYNMTKGGEGGDTSAYIDYSKFKWHGEHNPMYGRRGKDNPNYGKKRSEESKHRSSISEYALKRSRPVVYDGISYPSVRKCAIAIGRSDKFVRKNGTFKV